MGFSRQEYWSGLPSPSPGDLPNSGIKPGSLMSSALANRFFTTSATWEGLLKRKIKQKGTKVSSESHAFGKFKSFIKGLHEGFPITSRQIDGKTMETMTDFILGGSKITAYGECSHEIKRLLLLGRNTVINLDNILKSRDITLSRKVLLVKAMVLPIVLVFPVVWFFHGLQHTRLPCPSPTPRVCSNSCPLNQWCHPTISSSVIPFSSCLQSFPASGSFQMSQFFASCGQSIGVSALASVLPMNIQDWFPLGWTVWISLQSKSLLQHHSSKASILWRSAFFIVQLKILWTEGAQWATVYRVRHDWSDLA